MKVTWRGLYLKSGKNNTQILRGMEMCDPTAQRSFLRILTYLCVRLIDYSQPGHVHVVFCV